MGRLNYFITMTLLAVFIFGTCRMISDTFTSGWIAMWLLNVITVIIGPAKASEVKK